MTGFERGQKIDAAGAAMIPAPAPPPPRASGARHLQPGEAERQLQAKHGVGFTDSLSRAERWDDEDLRLMCHVGLNQSGAHVWLRFYREVLMRLGPQAP